MSSSMMRHELEEEEMFLMKKRTLTTKTYLLAHAAVFVANLLFGCGNVVAKVGLHDMNPILFALIREVISGPLLLTCAYFMRRSSESKNFAFGKEDLWRFLVSGLGVYGSNLCYILGVKFAGATSASMWQPAQPLFITLLAIVVRLENATVMKFLGILIAGGGCTFVSLWDAKGDDGNEEIIGNILFFVQAICCAVFYVGEKPLLKKFEPITVVGASYIVATVFMTVTAVGINSVDTTLHFLCEDCGSSGWTVPKGAWWAINYWIFAGSIGGYLLNTWGNQYVDTSIVGIYAVVQPIVTVIVSSVVIAMSSPPHWNLEGLGTADLGAIGIVLGLAIVVYDNVKNSGTRLIERKLQKPVTSHYEPVENGDDA